MLDEFEDFKAIKARYPHIASRLAELWGKDEFGTYVRRLLDDIKEGRGQGLPNEVVGALAGLLHMHDQDFKAMAALAAEKAKHGVLAGNEHFELVNQRYPRIGDKLGFLWGSAEFSKVINELLQDSRDGARAGFPNDVAVALFKLMMMHDNHFPQHALNVTDIWVMK